VEFVGGCGLGEEAIDDGGEDAIHPVSNFLFESGIGNGFVSGVVVVLSFVFVLLCCKIVFNS